MRFAAVVVWALSLAAAAYADSQTFTFESDNPSGVGKHAGAVTVTETAHPNVYDVVWTIPEGSLKGVALLDEGSDTLYASYQLDGVPGLVVLQEGTGRSWSGHWYQSGRKGAEVWKPAK